MMKIETRDLGEAGRAYLIGQLTNINVLCTALLDALHVAPGEVFTLAPSNTSTEHLFAFDQGGLLPENLTGAGAVSLADGSTLVPVASLIERQIALIREAMVGEGDAVCIADDVNPRWSDRAPYLGSTAFGVGEEVYHLLTRGHAESDFVEAVSNKSLWHDVAAVCRVPPKLDDARLSTPSELQRSGASAVLITCNAYDGEGFVVWRRTTA